MEQKSLSNWLKYMIVGTGVCGLVICAVVVTFGIDLRESYPEWAHCFWPWLIFLCGAGIPCYAVLSLAWGIATNIGYDRSFSEENAKMLLKISCLAAGDTGFFFLGNVLLLLLNMNHPGIILASLVIVFIGVAISVAFAALSHLVKKAAALQEQSDWTI